MSSFGPSLSYLCGPAATMASHLWYIILCRHFKMCIEISGPHLCPVPWCGLSRCPLNVFPGHCLGPLPTLFLEPRVNIIECLAAAADL